MRYLPSAFLALALLLPACDAGGLLVVVSTGSGGSTTSTTHATGGAGGAGGHGGADAGSLFDAPADTGTAVCLLAVCPVGAFALCEPVDTMTPCCKDSAIFNACSRPAGILTHDGCGTCAAGECAISPKGAVTCCDNFGTPSDPCGKIVP